MNMIASASSFAPAGNAAFVLSSRAMLASVKITQWTARKLDRKVTQEANDANGATADAGRYNKALLASSALAEIVSTANAARAFHYARTLPWADDGARILPAAAYVEYAAEMRKHREGFESAVAAFVANYGQYVDDARARLGSMYNSTDYPSAQEIAARFSFQTRLYQVPVSEDFRAQLSDSDVAAIRGQMEAENRATLAAATRDVWQRIAETVGHMATKLSEFKPAADGNKASGIFRDSLVENVRSLAHVLPSLNITGDAALDAIAKRITSELCGLDAVDLRESDHARQKVQTAAAEIVAAVSDYI